MQACVRRVDIGGRDGTACAAASLYEDFVVSACQASTGFLRAVPQADHGKGKRHRRLVVHSGHPALLAPTSSAHRRGLALTASIPQPPVAQAEDPIQAIHDLLVVGDGDDRRFLLLRQPPQQVHQAKTRQFCRPPMRRPPPDNIIPYNQLIWESRRISGRPTKMLPPTAAGVNPLPGATEEGTAVRTQRQSVQPVDSPPTGPKPIWGELRKSRSTGMGKYTRNPVH